MVEATKTSPAPLDAFETAKPDEPIFTLQGGDPLAPPLVRLWTLLARVRAGAASGKLIAQWVGNVEQVAKDHALADDPKEARNLQVRATAAEEVSWAMDSYAKGEARTDVPSEAQDTHLDELQRIDLHDYRVRAAQRLSNFRCELLEIRDELCRRGYENFDLINIIEEDAISLKRAGEILEPRRMMKRNG